MVHNTEKYIYILLNFECGKKENISQFQNGISNRFCPDFIFNNFLLIDL